MKSFADWTQEIAESQNMEPEPDRSDSAADGAGYASAHYGYVTCPHCGYDIQVDRFQEHTRQHVVSMISENLRKNNELLRRLKL